MGPAIASGSRGHAPARPSTQKNSRFLNLHVQDYFQSQDGQATEPNKTAWVYESGGNETKKYGYISC
jgi:hypothetical protein